jgi:hypothetical protein
MAEPARVSNADLAQNRDLYFRLCLKIRPKKGGELIPFVMRPSQRRLAQVIDAERAAGRPPRIMILKARQQGFSTFGEAELFRDCHLKKNQQALVAAHKAESSEYLFGMAQRFYDNLPERIKPKRRYNTKRVIHFAHNNSRMQVEVAGESRGFTGQRVHISEAAFIENADDFFNAILQVVPDEVDSLVIAESTANGVGNWFHNNWVAAVHGQNDWVPFFVPWFEDPTYQRRAIYAVEELADKDREKMARYKLTLEQMAWYVWTRTNKCSGDQDKMDQEYPCNDADCFLASGRKVFDTEGLRHYIEASEYAGRENKIPDDCEIDFNPADKKNPIVRMVKGGRWKIYVPPIARHMYIFGWDLSEGDPGSDWSPGVALNQHTLGIDAIYYARTPPDLCARQAAAAAWWYNGGRIAAEANNHGIEFHAELIKHIQYPNIQMRRVSETSVAGRFTDKPGVWTSGENRTNLVNLVRRYVREKSGECLDPRMIREWQTLYYDKMSSGVDRVDHPDGEFMDLTMAMAMALYSHSGGFENTLEPLPLAVIQTAPGLYREILARQSMGKSSSDIDLGVMTFDEIAKLDDYATRRDQARQRNGLGGFR